MTFLGIKFKVVLKEKKWVIKSHVSDKSKANLIEILRKYWKNIINPIKEKDIYKNISLYNATIINFHNYYKIATLVSEDFANIGYKVNGKQSALNYNSRKVNISTCGPNNSNFINQKYGKSKQLRWINGRVIIPIGYVQHEFPKYKRRAVNKYSNQNKNQSGQKCIDNQIVEYLIRNAYLYPTFEMADNALSKYIAQGGKCAITQEPLTIGNMECHHIKPVRYGRNDSINNLMMLTIDAHKIITVTKKETINYYISKIQPTIEMQEKINHLRALQGLEQIQFIL